MCRARTPHLCGKYIYLISGFLFSLLIMLNNLRILGHSGGSARESTGYHASLSSPRATISIGFSCVGQESAQGSLKLLTSIFLFSKSKSNLLVLSDNICQGVLEDMPRKLRESFLTVSFYPFYEHAHRVSMISSKHYSALFTLIKLAIDQIFLEYDKVLFLDLDTIVIDDLEILWNYFDLFNKTQAWAFAENQSSYYLGYYNLSKGKVHRTSPWPADGSGINGGVLLADLKKCREMSWANVWQTIYNRTKPAHPSLWMADQDIFNTVFKMHPHLLYRLPCRWNIQFSQYGNFSSCYRSEIWPGILHVNNPKRWNFHKFLDSNFVVFSEITSQYASFNHFDSLVET